MINDDKDYNGSMINDIGIWHHGILGMKWGVRRYQNKDGSLTSAGKKRYSQLKEAADKAEQQGNTNKASKIRNDAIYKRGKTEEDSTVNEEPKKKRTPEEDMADISTKLEKVNKELDDLESKIVANEKSSPKGGKSAADLQQLMDADSDENGYENWNKIRDEMVEKIGDPYSYTSSWDYEESFRGGQKAKTKDIQNEVDRYSKARDYFDTLDYEMNKIADDKFGSSGFRNYEKKWDWVWETKERTGYYKKQSRNKKLHERYLIGKALEALGYDNTKECRDLFYEYGLLIGE